MNEAAKTAICLAAAALITMAGRIAFIVWMAFLVFL
jgi:hypothetical protein